MQHTFLLQKWTFIAIYFLALTWPSNWLFLLKLSVDNKKNLKKIAKGCLDYIFGCCKYVKYFLPKDWNTKKNWDLEIGQYLTWQGENQN